MCECEKHGADPVQCGEHRAPDFVRCCEVCGHLPECHKADPWAGHPRCETCGNDRCSQKLIIGERSVVWVDYCSRHTGLVKP
jgi:hypothetical protein